MKQLPLIFVFLFGIQHFTKGNSITDSLQKQLSNRKDTNEVMLLSELCWQFSTVSSDSAVLFGQKALKLSEEIGYKKGIAQAYNDIGIAQYYGGKFTEAIQSYEQSLAIRFLLGDKRDIAAVYNKLGIVYQKLSKFTEALYYNILALKLFEEIGFDKGVSYGYNNVAIIYDNIGNADKAIFYHQKSIEIKLKINDQVGLAGSYSNLGNVYRQIARYDLSKAYYAKSIAILRQIEDPEYLSSALNNLGNLYVLTGQAKIAIPFMEEGMRIREKNTDLKALVSSYVNLADGYNQLNDHKKEEYYLRKALQLSDHLEGMRELAVLKVKAANAFAKTGNIKEAITLYQQHIALNDTLLNTDVVTKVAEMETKYDTEKKEAQNKLLHQENQIQELALERKQVQLIALFGAFLLCIVIAVFSYKQYTYKKEREFNAALLKEEKRRLAAIISTQEEERKRISGELHDGIGQMLSVVKMNMSAMEEELPLQQVKQAIQLLDESCSELRNISHHLMPAVLMKKGLVKAVEEFCATINSSKKIHLSFYADTFDRIHGSIEVNVYRIIQELVQNIVKYAQATEVNLNINHENGMLKLMISDNGIGINMDAIKHSNGNGWNNIYSRVSIMNAHIEIDSSPTNGTTIFIDVPLALKEESILESIDVG